MRQRLKEDRKYAYLFGGKPDASDDLSTVQPIDTSRKLPTRPAFSPQGQRLVDMNTPPDNAALEAEQRAAWAQPVVPPKAPAGASEEQPWGTTSMDTFAAAITTPTAGDPKATAGGTSPATMVYEKKDAWRGGGDWRYEEMTSAAGTAYYATSPKTGKMFVITPGTKNPTTGEDMFEAIRKERAQLLATASETPSVGKVASATPSSTPQVAASQNDPTVRAAKAAGLGTVAKDEPINPSSWSAASGGPMGYSFEGGKNPNQLAVDLEQVSSAARAKAAKAAPPKPRYVSDMGTPKEEDMIGPAMEAEPDLGQSLDDPNDPMGVSQQVQRSFQEMVDGHEAALIQRPAGERMPAKAKTDLYITASDPDPNAVIMGYVVKASAGGNVEVTDINGRPVLPTSPNYIKAITLAVRQDLVQTKMAERGSNTLNTAPNRSADMSAAMAANMPKS